MLGEKATTPEEKRLSQSGRKRGLSGSSSEYDNIFANEYEGEYYGEISIPHYIGIGSWTSSSVELTEEADENPLSLMESSGIVCLLQDAIDELIILKYVIGAPVITQILTYRTLTERYTRRLTPVRIFPEVESTPVFTSAIKLQRDRGSIETIFGKVTKSLIDTRTYIPLVSYLRGLKNEEEDDKILVEELRSNLLNVKNLKVKLEEKRKVDELEEKEREELMYQLQDELDGVALKCEVEQNFVNKWENVRNAQNRWKLTDTENDLRNNIADYTTKMNLERRVTYEIQSYLKVCQTELEEKLEEWMTRYDAETERRENRLANLKHMRDQEEEKKYQLHQLYEARNFEMKKWIEFRDLRRIRAAACLTIQSWWRGLIVRKKLSLKKAKKPKKNKKEGGKK